MEKIKQALERARNEQSSAEKARSPQARQRADASIDDSRNIEYTQTKVIQIDAEIARRNKILLGTGDESAEMAYKLLRTHVEQRLAARGWNSVAVTSPGVGQGKTTTAINLSIALAHEMHRTVLLVDLDLRNPTVAKKFGLEPKAGLVDYLTGDVPVSEILMNPGVEGLVILPSGGSVPNSSELIASPRMVRLVDELKHRYTSRFIVFDLPPILLTDDMLAFSPYTDAILMVIEDGVTTKNELTRSMEMLAGSHLLGTVLNKAEFADDNYSYYQA